MLTFYVIISQYIVKIIFHICQRKNYCVHDAISHAYWSQCCINGICHICYQGQLTEFVYISCTHRSQSIINFISHLSQRTINWVYVEILYDHWSQCTIEVICHICHKTYNMLIQNNVASILFITLITKTNLLSLYWHFMCALSECIISHLSLP